MSELARFYQAVLESVDCRIDEDGNILTQLGDPITILMDKKEKKLVLPTRDALKHADWVNSIGFHPTCESIYGGQSPIISLFLRLLGRKFHTMIQTLAADIINLALKPDEHEKLTLSQAEYIRTFGKVTHGVEKLMADVIKVNTGVTGSYPLLSFRLHRGHKINEEVYSRTCTIVPNIVNSELFKEVITKSHSETSRKALIKIYESLFPPVLEYGSNHSAMPYFMVTMEAFYHFAVHLNKIIDVLGKYTSATSISVGWYETLKSSIFKTWVSQIPILRGNAGEVSKKNDKVDDTQVPVEDVIPARPGNGPQPRAVSNIPEPSRVNTGSGTTQPTSNYAASLGLKTIDTTGGIQPFRQEPVRNYQPLNNPVVRESPSQFTSPYSRGAYTLTDVLNNVKIR